ncbi:protein NLP4 [Punica granatum]|uniref:Uncharacterized protein n=2 Tax=Punica granatum TaxID=22663 RepID=A0A218WCN7_PUNGR|nr:protein NLP4 [Punica granatum]XP_031407255.1 protein NLP4 [Punica granatum]OWM70575.1 hypothetical protein CDL15_Pgr014248 [Punica granatum]PKI55109.1 hypothetical protein CRG98_024400 [Punica granatum]
MEDIVFSPSTVLGTASGSIMDIDLMDELLLDGCWLETMCGSEFLQPSHVCDPLFMWATPEVSTVEAKGQELGQGPLVPEDVQVVGQNAIGAPALVPSHLGNLTSDGSDLRRTWWIGPRVNSGGPATSVMDRLIKALGYIQDFTKDKDVLIQLWVPVNRGGKQVLTTSEQPFSLNSSSGRLLSYRDVSVHYEFSAEKDSKEMVGMPGRVFLGKVPEWTPDVRFFRSDEYARVDHAQQFDVRGTLALPVFEQSSRTCLGVIEIVMTTQKIKYRPEIESVCKALEAVDLRSSGIFSNRNIEYAPKSYEAALPEILEVLRSACKTHGLPLSQTWIPCTQQGKAGCRHSDENFALCVSPVDTACHVADSRVQGFHEACSEHHLLMGQGVAGKAFLTNQPCFSPDVTSFGKTDYPLSHHARMFGLCGAVAIRFRSIQTGTADYVLEFFLPRDCKELEDQRTMLTSLSVIIQQICRNLRVVTDEELRDEVTPSSFYRPMADHLESEPTHREETPGGENVSSEKNSSRENSQRSGFVSGVDGDRLPLAANKDKMGEILSEEWMEFGQQNRNSTLNASSEHCEDRSSLGDGGFSGLGLEKPGEKRRSKAEKTITLQVLRQYFAGSLKDAAKSLGVCPTTLKRICRQHGINRWPSRKIKKVGHSLQKLQVVIDSVQGTSGSLQVGSFYTNFPELASPNLSTTGPFPSPKTFIPQKPQSTEPESANIGSQSAASKSSSSSGSQSSSSSQCCSSGRQQHSSSFDVVGSEDPMVSENDVSGQLKRFRGEVELNGSSHEGLGTKLTPRSQSYEILKETRNPETPPDVQFHCSDASRKLEPLRVKVTYGEEKIRFRLQKGWGLMDLWKEIQRRFSVEDPARFDLRYLDDDYEWVMLTCDADLEECINVSRSFQGNTIRLSLQVSHHYHGSSVGSSGGPL